MIYFSTLKDTKIFTQDKQYFGKLIDLLFIPIETPLVTKFVVKTKTGKMVNIPIQFMKKTEIGFIVVSNYETKEKSDEEISLLYKIQNQQIVDIEGTEVIRVNDVVINDIPNYTISGIDIGILGIFRWVGIAKFVAKLLSYINVRYKSDYIPWSELEEKELANGRIILKSEKEQLNRMRPEDLAEHLQYATIRNVLRSLRVMDKELSAKVVADLNVDYQRKIFQRFSEKDAGKILSLIDADEAVDVLLSLDSDRRKNILAHINHEKKTSILHLLRHAKTPIGHLMTAEYLSVYADTSIKNVLDELRKNASEYSELHYIYIINNDKQIVGVINSYEIIIQSSDMPLYGIMNQNLVLGRLTTPKEIVLRRLIKYNLHALPIVDEERKLLGIVTLQDIAREIFENK